MSHNYTIQNAIDHAIERSKRESVKVRVYRDNDAIYVRSVPAAPPQNSKLVAECDEFGNLTVFELERWARL